MIDMNDRVMIFYYDMGGWFSSKKACFDKINYYDKGKYEVLYEDE